MKESLRLNLSLDLSLVKTLVKLISVDDNIEFSLVQFNSVKFKSKSGDSSDSTKSH